MNMLKSLIIALAMYSKLPVPNIDWDEKNMRYAMCFFPVVGVIIGALVFGAGQLILRYTECGKLFFAAVMTMIPVAVTGGIHLDGFADTIDAVSSYKDREKKLEILKDPHTGAFAVIGLCAYFLITAALWSEVNLKTLSLAVWMYPISRALSGLSVVSFRSAKSSGLLRTFQERADRKRTRIVLSIWLMSLAAGAIYIFRVQGAIIVTAALFVFFYYYKMSFKQFGGITGDLAGYFLQICELVMLTVVAFLGGIC